VARPGPSSTGARLRIWREDVFVRRTPALLVVAALLALSACTAQIGAAKRDVPVSLRSTTTTATTTLPAVTSSTLQQMAAIAESAAVSWSEPHPWDIRAMLATQSGAETIGLPFAYGESSPQFVIALDGRFACKPLACATSGGGGPNPESTTTTATTQAPIMTMLLTVDPSTLKRNPSIAVEYHDVDMNTLGKVYALDASVTTTVPHSQKALSGSSYCTGSASGDAHAQLWTRSMNTVYATCGDRTGNTYFIIEGKWYYTVGAVPAG